MAHHDEFDIYGDRLECHVERERILDESGEELVAERVVDVRQTFGGTVERAEENLGKPLPCGHVYRLGDHVAICMTCTKNAKRSVFVCGECSVTCPVTGESRCKRCAVAGPRPDGRFYAPAGLKRAKKLGWFDAPKPSTRYSADLPRRRSFIARILEWW